MADIAIFRINYKSDFILTLQSDAGWLTPFCIKFWTGAPSKAYYAYYDGMSYTHCTPVEGDPTKLLVQFDDHHLPIGDLKFQIGYHFTVADFPTSVEDEVINQAAVIINNDGEQQQVMLDFNGETAPEIEFSLPAYANEAQRIANEQARIAAEEQRISNEEARIAAEQERQQNEQQRISREQQRIEQEQQRVNAEAERVSDFASLKTESEAATAAANIAATLANEKAQLADDKAALAQAAATLANEKAQLAEDKANLAQQKADYAQTQGNYAKAQGDAAKTEAEAAHSLNEEVSHDEATRQQQEAARQQAEAQRVIDFNAQMQQQQTAYTNAEAARDTAFDEAETERDAKVDEKVADITNLQAQLGYFVCDTAAATAAKTIAATGYVLGTGGSIKVKMTNDNTVNNATLNINSTGAKRLFYEGVRASSTNTWKAGETVEVYYDGTNFYANNVAGGGGDGVFDVSEKYPTSGVEGGNTYTLEGALAVLNTNLSASKKKGGMSIKFIQSSDNKYVRYNYLLSSTTDADITNAANWQSTEEELSDLEENALRTVEVGETSDETVNLIDRHGYILGRISEDGIKTKNFDSSELNPLLLTKEEYNAKNVVESPVIGIESPEEINIIDPNYNILARINENGIKTKNFDSGSNIGTVTLQNSDIITILGSSFGETESFPTNKHWSGIMSMFSDYRIQNLSLGGANVVTTLYRIRSGKWNIQGKYVVITNNENIFTLDITKYINGLDNLCATLIGMGKVPIVCTNYHKSQLMSMAIEKYAYEHNLMFWDCSKYCSSLTSGIYGGFDDGAHLRKRNAPMVAYAYLNHLHKMGKPFSSIKVFDIRDSSFSGTLDNLIYSDNIERSKLFKEIKISSTSNLDEYNKLISKTEVSFGKYGLIEVTVPSVSKYVESLKLNLDTNNTGVKVYVKNTNVSPYPNPSSSSSTVRFSVSETVNIPSLGDVYSNGGVNYTVQAVILGENNYYCTIYCTPSTLPSSQTGTLTVVSQVSGSTGSSSIPFVMVEEAVLDLNEFIVEDNQGHWVELTGTNNSYEVPSNLFIGSIQIDKISFLIEATSSTFQLKDVKLDYRASELKGVEPNKDFVWNENNFIHTNELLQETTFGSVGTTTQNWVDGNGDGIVSVADYKQKYPAGANSMIKVSDTLSMNTFISSSVLDKQGDMCLEIYCRYFPAAPTPYSQESDTNVNNNSYDFNTLYIKYGSNSSFTGANTAIVTEEIGLYWKIVRIPLCWFRNSKADISQLYLSLYSNNKGIEICKVSLKYNN